MTSINNRGLYLVAFLIATMCVSCTKNDSRKLEESRPLVIMHNNSTSSRIPIPFGGDGFRTIDLSEARQTFLNQGIDALLAQNIFDDVASVDTFKGRYFKDGQFARMHAMRRYVEAKYQITVRKIFAFGRLTAFSRSLDCYAAWQYDVACVIQVGGEPLVFDPKLFTSPVNIQTWLDAHVTPTSCESAPVIENYLIVSGESFTPTDGKPSGFIVDPLYEWTQTALRYYQDSIGCH